MKPTKTQAYNYGSNPPADCVLIHTSIRPSSTSSGSARIDQRVMKFANVELIAEHLLALAHNSLIFSSPSL